MSDPRCPDCGDYFPHHVMNCPRVTRNPTTAAEWVRTVPLDCPHSKAREVYVCYDCAAANLDAYARQQVREALEEAYSQISSIGTHTQQAMILQQEALRRIAVLKETI